jgi:TolB-like protein
VISALAFVSFIALVAVGVFYFGSSSTRTRINSVAVLPFANASSDPNTEYLSDGITEGVIDRLSGLPNIKVISRTSAFRYKKRDIEPQKVARELGVQALVTGRVTQRGDDLSVSVELVDAHEDKQLWGAVQPKARGHRVSAAGNRKCHIWKSAASVDQRRQDPFGEVIRDKS